MSGTSPLRPSRPQPHRLAELATALGLPIPAGDTAGDTVVTGVTHDSSAVRPGDLLAALPGSRTHGARFAAAAAANGAVAIFTDPAGAELAAGTGLPVLLADRPRPLLGALSSAVYGDPTAGMLVIGVTGTNGKTTTAYLLEEGLRAGGHVTGLIGTVETRVDGESVPSTRTTPEATDLQATFAVMAERGVTAVAMEVSSHALALGRVDGTRFTAGAFTNLSQDHLDFHTSMEDYFAAKAMLFDGRCPHEIVTVDDPYGKRLVKPGTVTVSAAGEPADWYATGIEPDLTGSTAFRVHGPGADLPGLVRMPGAFNVANGLLAIAILATVGVPVETAVRGVAARGVPGRMEKVDLGQGYVAVVDYAHTPVAVERMLAELRPTVPGRVIVVLGAGGDRDRDKRPLMGAAGAAGSDLLLVTDDNPRSEDPAAIRSAVLAGARGVEGRGEVVEVGDRRAAVAEAVRRARPGDAVVVAGKGHEQGQEVAGVVHPFDDRAVLRAALEELTGSVGR
ncbi:MAG TPA: UDP-N-acetylmuramoyl-L-alanyl-D-glutamate--2,6-diaminopimelate ligase [Mycobacteriales bacterium]|nr:UDP-N-acetylmuramoyl-L-alanyl-D-glutamate--2,6-diaminopimelate ligase [Mycobacteriales bacterium]